MAIAFPKPPDAPVNIIFFSLNAAIVVDEHSGNKTMRSCPCMYVCVLLLFSADRTINFQIRADVRHKMGKKPTNNLIEGGDDSFLPSDYYYSVSLSSDKQEQRIRNFAYRRRRNQLFTFYYRIYIFIDFEKCPSISLTTCQYHPSRIAAKI